MNQTAMECYLEGWKRTFIYKGCASRRAFWLFILINVIIVMLLAGLSYFFLAISVTDQTARGGMMLVWMWYVFLPLSGLVPLLVLPSIVSLGIRRMHDAGLSGWWFGGAILINLFVLPLLLTALHHVALLVMDTAAALRVMNLVGMLLSTLAALGLIWLCCKPTKQPLHESGE